MDISAVVEPCVVCGQVDCDHTDEQRAEYAAALAEGHEPPTFADDPAQQSAKRKRNKRAETAQVDDLKWLMKHRSGRRHVYTLLIACHIFESTYLRSRGDHGAMCFTEGERNIGLYYLDLVLKYSPDTYQLMMQENGGTRAF
jgi:hypothetical protein